MSSKTLLKFLGGCLALTFMFVLNVQKSGAQVISAPRTNTPSGQIIAPFDTRNGRDTWLQVTNIHPSDTVDIHVQILTGSDCVDNNYFDTLTAQDTMIMRLSDLETNGGSVFDPLTGETEDTMGVIVITPTVGSGPDADGAKSFNFLHGVVNILNTLKPGEVACSNGGDNCIRDSRDTKVLYTFNAAGRNAVTTSGALVAKDLPLDGESAFFESINPSEFNIHYTNAFDINFHSNQFADIFFVSISDDYGVGGGSYAPVPDSFTTTRTDTFDQDETFRSCNRDLTFSCKENIGINNSYPTSRAILGANANDNSDQTSSQDILSDCSDNLALTSDSDDFADKVADLTADDCDVICETDFGDHETGYTRLRSIVSDADVYFGIIGLSTSNLGGADYIHVE